MSEESSCLFTVTVVLALAIAALVWIAVELWP